MRCDKHGGGESRADSKRKGNSLLGVFHQGLAVIKVIQGWRLLFDRLVVCLKKNEADKVKSL